MQEIFEKAKCIDTVASCLDGLSIQELMMKVDTLKVKIKTSSNLKRGDNLTGSVAHMEQWVGEFDNFQKLFMQMIDDLSENYWVAPNVVRVEIANVSVKVNLTIRAMRNKAPTMREI